MANKECDSMAIGFTSTDMTRSIKFYREQLGFELSECWPDEKNAMWCNLLLAGQSVMFGAAMKPEQATQMCGKNEIGFRVVPQVQQDDVGDGFPGARVGFGLDPPFQHRQNQPGLLQTCAQRAAARRVRAHDDCCQHSLPISPWFRFGFAPTLRITSCTSRLGRRL